MSDSDSDDVWEPEEDQPKAKAKPKPKPKAKEKEKAAPKKKAASKPRKPPAKKRKTITMLGHGSSDDEDEDEDGDVVMREPTGTQPSPSKQSIEQIYQKKTQLEHILLRPDTYIGSIEPVTQSMWVFDEATKKMDYRKITFTPGMYKIFDEIIVNACDNKQRDRTMDTLRVTIDRDNGEISVWNNGRGIPIALHKEHKVYVPELIFGHLLTGSNFNDKEKKTVGGRNGYGAKLTNIFSHIFTIETADSKSKQRYKQVFESNMAKKHEPVITPWSKKDFTCITFKPDLERFKMTTLDDDIVALFKKRVYDVAGVTDRSLNVYLNDEKITIKSFTDYVQMYQPEATSGEEGETAKKHEILFDKPDGRWHVGIGLSDDGFQQVSFVNGICTTKGGQHVNYIADQVVNKLVTVVKKKNKGEAVKPNYIKNHMTVYVSCLIDNPAFDSQTKETLTTRPPAFGSTYTLSDKFLKQVEKSGMVERILSFAQYKQTAELRRKGGGGVKRSKITGIVKLDDANMAGTSKAHQCTLIVTEGDSAKSLAVSGLAVVGRDYYGVFPLRGKLLNVRDAAHQQILKNEEIQNLVKILGLRYGQQYDSIKSLRYGHLMIMADQDHDGSHIKGLVINFIHHFWPSLLTIEGFLQEFITPIVKVSKGRTVKSFFTIPEYEAWREQTNNGRGWNIKYYKGLGTSTAAEAKEYFSDLQTHQIGFTYGGSSDGDNIDMAFSKKRVEERKDWLRGYEAGTHVDYDVEEMDYTEFVNKELILFSMADNIRSIPSLVDGFKPSQRKVLFGCFKRNLRSEIKVVQLAGYVSEHSAYHHGEQSLSGTIINMAQDFVGSNNIHLLSPNGQFGTRILGGKDAASPRYIFTNLEPLARRIFDPLDNDVLTYLDDDGQSIEPEWYVPIIPMVLVNGSEGIGTGWSSSIPNFNPFDLIKNLRHKIMGEEMEPIKPWYRGFRGEIIEKARGRSGDTYVVQGKYETPDETTLVITELPVKTWTQTYKQFLEGLLEAGTIKDFRENHTDTTVLFTITMEEKTLRDLSNAEGGIVKKFKLEASISTSNMHLFDAQGRIKKYETPLEIIDEFFTVRLEYYDKRKEAILKKLSEQIKLLSNKTRFILAVVDGELVVSKRKQEDILRQLADDGYDQILPKSSKAKVAQDADKDSEEEELSPSARGYDYLLSMKISSLTKEKVEKLQAELGEHQKNFKDLEATAVNDLWMSDLEKLEALIKETEEEREKISTSVPAKKRGGNRRVTAKRAKKRKNRDSDDESDSDFEVASKRKPRAKPAAKPSVPSAPKPRVTKKPSKTSATQPITSFFGAQKTSEEDDSSDPTTHIAEEPKDDDKSDDDLEFLSLAERLARRGHTPPKSKKPAPKQPAKKASNLVDLASSSDDDKDNGNGAGSDDDVFAMESTTKPAKKAAPAKKAPAKRATKSSAPARATKKPKASKTPASSDESAAEEEEAAPAPRRATRVRKAISYVELSSDDEDEEEEASDSDAKPKRRATKKKSAKSSDDESAFSDDDDE